MPKQKTNKAAKKRFKITKKGKLRRYRAGVGHLNSHKTRRRKAHLRHPLIHEGKQVRTIKRLLARA
jgi:large subunit ribosomal protein L35